MLKLCSLEKKSLFLLPVFSDTRKLEICRENFEARPENSSDSQRPRLLSEVCLKTFGQIFCFVLKFY